MWNPAQYELFKNERSRPFFDLLELVRARSPGRVIDLGCGTGELTKILHERIASKETTGIDSSQEMLKKAPMGVPNLLFKREDIAEFSGDAEYDVIFSNAALHWVNDHEALFGKLSRALTPNGELAVQMPANFDHVSHAVATEIAESPKFARLLSGYVRHAPVLAPEAYATLLEKIGMQEQRVRLEVYAHRLESRAGVVEWVKGTLLTDYAKRLDAAAYEEFLAEYTKEFFARVPDERPFFYPFKRILLWGARRAS